MQEPTDKQLAKWKAALAKTSVYYKTEDEYREAVHNLVGYFDVLVQMELEQKRKVQKT